MPFEDVQNVIEAFYDPATQLGLGMSDAAGTETVQAAGTESPMDVVDTPEPQLGGMPKAPKQQSYDSDGSYKPLTNLTGARASVVEMAKQFLGADYVWGGNKVTGTDCSGFVQQVLKMAGIKAPRVSYQQAQMGKRIDISKLRPGDLVAWDNSSRNNGADHIAVYLGNGYIQESPRAGVKNRIRKLHADEGAWGVALNYGD